MITGAVTGASLHPSAHSHSKRPWPNSRISPSELMVPSCHPLRPMPEPGSGSAKSPLRRIGAATTEPCKTALRSRSHGGRPLTSQPDDDRPPAVSKWMTPQGSRVAMNLSPIKRAIKQAVRREAIRGGLEATSLARHILPASLEARRGLHVASCASAARRSVSTQCAARGDAGVSWTGDRDGQRRGAQAGACRRIARPAGKGRRR